MIKLNEVQRKSLSAILWLTNPIHHRSEGRTTLLAHAFITHALNYPETRIDVRDHYPNRQSNFRLMRMIQDMVSSDKFCSERIIMGPDWIISNTRRRIK